MTRGGKRPGAGRKPGSKNAQTIEREKVLDEIRNRVGRTAQRILDAQYSIALGQQFLYMVEQYKNGQKSKPKLITDESTIRAYLNGELDNQTDEYYFITTKEPNNQAIDSLLDRTFGKSTQGVELSGKDGNAIEIKGVNIKIRK